MKCICFRIALFTMLFITVFITSQTNAISQTNNIKSFVEFFTYEDGSKTISNACSEILESDKIMPNFLKTRYGISDYSKADFKFKLCGAKVMNCYASRNNKYFIADQKYIEKHGRFYFGSLQNDDARLIISSVGWCESNFNPNAKSPDGGYGIYQITPSAIGDKSLLGKNLFDMEFNTQYAVSLMSKNFNIVKKTYVPPTPQSQNFYQYLTLRGYNGGFKQLSRIIDKKELKAPYVLLVGGNYLDASKFSGRFVCFEKVNVVYPLKVYMTFDNLKSREIGSLK